MKAFVPFLLGLCLLGSAAQAAVKQRKPKGKELAQVKQALQGKAPVAKKTLHVSMKGTGAFLFAPVMDFSARPPLQLHLIQNGKILQTLAPTPGDKRWPILRFESVTFKDVNDDGYEDVVTLTRYMPVTGPQKDQAFNQAAVYLSRGGKSFELLLGEAHDTLNAEPPPPSMGEALKRLKQLDKKKLALPAQSNAGSTP
ncbi:MAG TPA: hypothetical protein VNA24_31175 [Hyalangium sp.]|jgi:hypothetical protein|nr:hypothetical protein [Hyalangium sp.]